MRISIRPQIALQPYIDRYWIWEGGEELPKILPGTGHELIFHYASLCEHISKDDIAPLPRGSIVSARKTCQVFKAVGKIGIIAVRFRSGAFRYFCHQDMYDLSDQIVDVYDVWGKSGEEMTERVISATYLKERITIIEKFMLNFLAKHVKPDVWLDQIINEIYYNYAALCLQEHYREWGISARHLRRKFKGAVGVSPKEFQRNSRFQAVIKRCLLEKRQDYLNIALDKGYYDQSHFIKDFQYFVGEAPAAFFQEKNFMSHFYNRSFQSQPIM